MWALAIDPKKTARAPAGTSPNSTNPSVGSPASNIIATPRAAAAASTVRDVWRARWAATSAPITVPPPSTAMRRPASPAPPWKVSRASSVRNVGKL